MTEEPLLSFFDVTHLICPLCSGIYSHIAKVGTELDPDEDETVIYTGTSIVFERASGERRSALRIDLMGECGHNWSLILQQHKGVMSVWARKRVSSFGPELHYPSHQPYR